MLPDYDPLTLPDSLEVEAPACLPDAEVEQLEGTYLDELPLITISSSGGATEPHANIVVRKPDGSLLLVYRHDFLRRDLCRVAYPAFLKANAKSVNRGAARGQAGRRAGYEELGWDGCRTDRNASPTPQARRRPVQNLVRGASPQHAGRLLQSHHTSAILPDDCLSASSTPMRSRRRGHSSGPPIAASGRWCHTGTPPRWRWWRGRRPILSFGTLRSARLPSTGTGARSSIGMRAIIETASV